MSGATGGPRYLTVGTTNDGATPILADVSDVFGPTERVRLLTDYQMIRDATLDGYPTRPPFTGSIPPETTKTITSGTVITLWQCEADALIAAGAAELA